MKEVIITTTTKKGEEALKQHYGESLKLRSLHKIQFRAMGYKQEIVSEKPFTMGIKITNKYFQMVLDPKDFKKKIKRALKENGAIFNTDYTIKID